MLIATSPLPADRATWKAGTMTLRPRYLSAFRGATAIVLRAAPVAARAATATVLRAAPVAARAATATVLRAAPVAARAATATVLRAAPVAVLAAALAACGDDATTTADAGADIDAGAIPDLETTRIGTIRLIEGGGFGSVFASIRDKPDRPAPSRIAGDGDCAVYGRPSPPLCDPPCENGVCIGDDECEPYPAFTSAGDIAVTGLVEPLTFTVDNFGYSPEPFPDGDLFTAGAEITATAPGAAAPGFTLNAEGVADLEADFPVTIELEDGVDEPIAWTADDGAATTRIALGLQVGWHGAPYEGLLLCDTDDDGDLVIPGALITALPRASSGLEQHSSYLVRYTRDVVELPAGPIDLLVGSQVTILQIAHP
jgi:hypothetical protein